MSEILVNSLKTAGGVGSLTFDSTGDVLLTTGRLGRVAGNTITIDSDGILNAASVNVSSAITLPAGAIDSAAIGTGAVSANKIASGAVEGAMTTQFGRRNIIINGAMQVWQRGTSRTGSDAAYLVDRLYTYSNYGSLSYTVSKSTDVPSGQGFANSISISANEAIASALSNYVMHRYYVESQDLDHLMYGTTAAKECTLSFWIKCPRTGNLTISFAHNGLGSQRQISRQVSITAADTWQKVIVSLPGDTGSAMNAVGSTSTGMFWDIIFNVQDSWGSGAALNTEWNNNDTSKRTVGQTQFLQDDGDTCYLTGMQLEVGTVATPFEHRSYGEELALCQRYCHVIATDGSGVRPPIANVAAYRSDRAYGVLEFPTSFRARPSLTKDYTATDNVKLFGNNGNQNSSLADLVLDDRGLHSARLRMAGTFVQGYAYWAELDDVTASAKLIFDAEL